jgi:hypothetical protein
MSTIVDTIPANKTLTYFLTADFLRLQAGVNVDLSFFCDGVVIAHHAGVGAGFSIAFDKSFDRVDCKDLSGANQALTLFLENGAQVRVDAIAGSISVINTEAAPVIVRTSNLAGVDDMSAATFYANATALAANTAVQVFAAGANINGAILYDSHISTSQAGNTTVTLLAKATAPATVIDGNVFDMVSNNANAWALSRGIIGSKKIAAGLGLYFISTLLEAGGSRFVSYKLL